MPKITIIIINYNGKKFLNKLFNSIKNQTFTNYEIIILDNNSTDESISYLRKIILKQTKLITKTQIICLKKNVGFAKANNIAANKALGSFLLFLNSDTILDKNAIKEMYLSLKGRLFIAGVAPKIYLSKFLPLKIFDSIGICINKFGSPYNRAIGQIDLGQYNRSEDIMGLCFACALVRRDVFINSNGLDSSYFAYFEDVDWSFRIKAMGYNFISCPNAIVFHFHSGTTSKNSYAWKYYLIFRNYLRTIVKSFGKKSIIKIIPRKIIDILKTIFSKETDYQLRLAMIKVLFNFIIRDWYVYTIKRLWYRKDFIATITDEEIFSYNKNEPSHFFNSVSYKPEVTLEMLDFIFNKLNLMRLKKIPVDKWVSLKSSIFCSKLNSDKWIKRFLHLLNYSTKTKLSYNEGKLIYTYLTTCYKK